MVEKVGNVTRRRYDEMVARSRKSVAAVTPHQFAVGDAALEIAPLGRARQDSRLDEVLEQFAEDIGLEVGTVVAYRATAAAWPEDKRFSEGVRGAPGTGELLRPVQPDQAPAEGQQR